MTRQMLRGREAVTPVVALGRVLALQAQEAASPYVALWNRIESFDAEDLDRAFADRMIVKAPLMRITLHAVAADDYATLHEAMLFNLRRARLNDARFRSAGVSIERTDRLVAELVTFAAEPRSKDDIIELLADRLGELPDLGLWWAIRTFAPLIHSPTEPPWSFGRRPVYEAPPSVGDRPTPAVALRHLVSRYLAAFGPATVNDFSQFTMERVSTARVAFDELGDEIVSVGGSGTRQLFDVAGAVVADGDEPCPPRLLAMWDSVLLAYADRARVIPEAYRREVIRRNGDVLPTVLVDGYVAGVWRPVDVGIEVTAFHWLDDESWAGIENEATGLLAFLGDRDPTAYSRYGRWWDTLPTGERRLFTS